MQDSRVYNLKSIQSAILYWLHQYIQPSLLTNLNGLSNGVLFSKLLSQIPKFEFMEEINQSEQSTYKLHIKIKNLRIIYDSVQRFYSKQLQKDISKFNISLGELCNGNQKDIIKFIELIIGCIMYTEKKKQFLESILLMPEQYQQIFMGLIKNGMNYSEDIDNNQTSRNKTRTLLERIDELEEQNISYSKNIDDLKQQLKEKECIVANLNSQIEALKKQNIMLNSEMDNNNKSSPQKSMRQSRRLEYLILEQKYNLQMNNSDIRIKQLQSYLIKAESKIEQIISSQGQVKQLNHQIKVLEGDLQNTKTQLQKTINLLKNKDTLLVKLKTKNQEYQTRILNLQRQLEEEILKYQRINYKQLSDERIVQPLKSHRVMTCLRQQMNSIAQQLTIQNSRLISQKIQKQQEYQQIILNQRQDIRKLKQLISDNNRDKRRVQLLSLLKKENVQMDNCNHNINIRKLVEEFTSGHHQELLVLIQLLNQKTLEIKQLQQEINKQKQTKQKRKKLLIEKASLIHPLKIL